MVHRYILCLGAFSAPLALAQILTDVIVGPTTVTHSLSPTASNIFASPTPGQVFDPHESITASWTVDVSNNPGSFYSLLLEHPDPTSGTALYPLFGAGSCNATPCVQYITGFGSATFDIYEVLSHSTLPIPSLEESEWFIELTWKSATQGYLVYDSGVFIVSNRQLTSSSTTTSLAQNATAPATAPPADSSSSGGLSTAGKAGIGAGVGVVALIGLVALFVFWRVKKKRSRAVPVGIAHPPNHVHELDHNQVHELSAETKPTELAGPKEDLL